MESNKKKFLDMKKLPLIIILLIFSNPILAQDKIVEVEGVVTYFFNDNLGNKADTGSNVFLRAAKYSDTINNTFAKQRYYEIIVNANSMTSRFIKKTPDREAELKSATDSLKLYRKLNKAFIQENKDVFFKATVDGHGRYKSKVPEGLYEIIVFSKNRSGRQLNRFVEIEKGTPMNLDFEFSRI